MEFYSGSRPLSIIDGSRWGSYALAKSDGHNPSKWKILVSKWILFVEILLILSI